MRLRDASAYNVQFDAGRPILIDSLSFERRRPTEPWPAYRQFCEHFLAPLALMAHRDARCGLMLRDFIDGIPLDLAARLLPGRTRLNLGLASHLHLHAGAQRRAAGSAAPPSRAAAPARRISETGQRALLDSLRRTVAGLRWKPSGHWAGYATATSYSEAATASKGEIVREMLASVGGTTAWDVGANIGVYSAMAADAGYRVIAWDQDAGSVEEHWRRVRGDAQPDDPAAHPRPRQPVAEPSAGGSRSAPRSSSAASLTSSWPWRSSTTWRSATTCRCPAWRELFARMAPSAIVEFVPKEDPMTRRLLAARRDIFEGYTIEGFRAAFGAAFEIVREAPVADSPRTLFLLRRPVTIGSSTDRRPAADSSADREAIR